MKIRDAWNKDTCAPAYRDRWSESDPAVGQCLVTALVVQDQIGGIICSCKVGNYSHFVNLTDDGTIIDLTKSQFHRENIKYTNLVPRDRNSLLGAPGVKQRYMLLKERVSKIGIATLHTTMVYDHMADDEKLSYDDLADQILDMRGVRLWDSQVPYIEVLTGSYEKIPDIKEIINNSAFKIHEEFESEGSDYTAYYITFTWKD